MPNSSPAKSVTYCVSKRRRRTEPELSSMVLPHFATRAASHASFEPWLGHTVRQHCWGFSRAAMRMRTYTAVINVPAMRALRNG